VKTVTVDTNVFPIDDLEAELGPQGFTFHPISVSQREVAGSSFEATLARYDAIPEIGVWGEGAWGSSRWVGGDDGDCMGVALTIVSNGSFPPSGKRDALSDGQRRQLRDAMIACTHRHDGRDILLSNDRKAFIDDGRREKFHDQLGVTIMTRAEFCDAYIPSSAP
jgi:hypothetical protein